MTARNAAKGREAENATAKQLQLAGMLHAERRTKRGGYVEVDGELVHADAGDITGVPGLCVQVKWSPYMPLAKAMAATERQRRAGRADIGLLVVKRKGVGLERAGEWDAYLPTWAVAELMDAGKSGLRRLAGDCSVWRTDLATAARLLSLAGYGDPERAPLLASDYARAAS